MSEQELILSKHWKTAESFTVSSYLADGGYEAAKKALGMEPGDVCQTVLDAGLRGRGGAGFPTGRKWMFMPKDDRPHYLLVNADEGEPGTFKDRDIMRYDPHMLIEGIIIACWAMAANTCYIYVRGEFSEPARRVEQAISEAYDKGFLGKGILDTDFDLDVYVHMGAGAYVCGEETGLISSLEGKKGQPRIRPPFPPQKGVFDMPTTVNNVESIAATPYIIANGPEAYKKFGTEKSAGTKLFCVSGHVNKPGVFELPLGVPLMELINDHAGGVLSGKALKAVIPGGSSTPVLKANECEGLNMDYESIAEAGSMLGSGAVIIMAEGTCMVSALKVLTHFYAHESCGQCTPCREGTGWMDQIMKRILHGRGRVQDLELLLSICEGMATNTICPLADAAVGPVKSFIEKFRPEFENYILERKEPVSNPWAVSWR
ncbi:MAG: NADH-quinone oxidoreductase subunit NuoF [bacterium]